MCLRVTVPDAGCAGSVVIPPVLPIHWDIEEVN
jgi:hypothetical protein